MRTEHLIILLAFIHWVADFIFQTDWMARNKSKSLKALGLHVAVYYGVLTSLLGLALVLAGDFNGEAIVTFTITNALLHFATDFITSKASARLYAKGDVHNFFVVVGFDQFIHLATFILTLSLLKP